MTDFIITKKSCGKERRQRLYFQESTVDSSKLEKTYLDQIDDFKYRFMRSL